MGVLTIIDRNAACDEAVDWPLFYMNDFSVLGLLVDKLAKALEVIEADGYRVVRGTCSAKVYFESHRSFKNIFTILTRNRIAYGSSDLVGRVYQG
ncbi:MAG: hypothetical protein PVG41_05145 [Desulfobacteraceae bacterium]|jgi:hypothetical protein